MLDYIAALISFFFAAIVGTLTLITLNCLHVLVGYFPYFKKKAERDKYSALITNNQQKEMDIQTDNFVIEEVFS